MRITVLTIAVLGLIVNAISPVRKADQPPFTDVATTDPLSPEAARKSFHLPPGFEIELVAAEPYVRKPININFDERGRLWVTESVEYPFAARPGDIHRDTVRILDWSNGRLPAEEVTTFATGLNIPIGVLPHLRGAIVYSIPHIYAFRDIDGDDRADNRVALYGPFGTRDTHGMTGEFVRGFDGWVYACHGYINTSRIRGLDGSEIEMNSGNVYRFKPNGMRVEQFTWGQVNPFGLAFDALGNLYSCDCHSRPVYQLLRGAHYPSFTKPDDGMGFGPDMTTDDHGSTAIAGIAYYAAADFPAEYRDNVFIGNVLTNRINRERVEWHGATPRALRQPDFLVSDDPWFRPVDIKLGPDGALYVADFYNRIIGHYEVPLTHPGRDRERGRIWRIVYRGPNGPNESATTTAKNLASASAAELVQVLAHPNLTVRMSATNQLADQGGAIALSAVRDVLDSTANSHQRIHALWILERTGSLNDEILTAAASNSDSSTRVHAMRIMAERKTLTVDLHRLAVKCLADAHPLVQRCAAEVLATHPTHTNLRPLLDLRHRVPTADTHLLHAVRLALREQLRAPAAWDYVESDTWNESDRRAIADGVPGVPGERAAAYLLRHLRNYPEPLATRARLVKHIARYRAASGPKEELSDLLHGDRGATAREKLALFQAMQQGVEARSSRLDESERRWGEQLARDLVAASDPDDVAAGITLAGAIKMKPATWILEQIVDDFSAPEKFRIAGLGALVAMDAGRAVPTLSNVLADPTAAITVRLRAATLLSEINQSAAHAEIVRALPLAPEKLAVVLARGLANNRASAEQLLEIIATGKASARLLQDAAVQIRLSRSDLPNWRPRVADLTRGLPSTAQNFDVLLKERKAGFEKAATDVTIGMQVFHKVCAACHQMANQGAKIGPQLDGIGVRGFDRLLEDIVDANRNVDQAFRASTLALSDGRLITGLVLREEGELIIMADDQGKENRIAKKEIEERNISPFSSMPGNLLDQISEVEFYHLMAYLLAQRPTGETHRQGGRN